MRRRLIGVIGHVDHGKTALVRALTSMDTDRLPEEKRRGISIALGFAHLGAGDAELDLIDMPGHERFVRTMIAGATGIESVLLVVAANEGIKPQTREHLDITALLGITRAIVAISKSDLVGPDEARRVAHETAALLATLGIAAPPPFACSTATGANIDTLREALLTELATERRIEDRGFPYLPIDRAFSLAGHGTIVTGTLRHGAIAVGDTLALVPGDTRLRVRGLQVHRTQVSRAEPGQRVAVNLRDIAASALGTGFALAAPGILRASRWISTTLRLAHDAPRALQNGDRLRLLFGTTETEARLRLLERDTLEAGDTGFAQLHCDTEVAIPARDPFILRTISPAATIAGGRVLDPAATRLRRHGEAVRDRLAALATGTPAAIFARELDTAEAGLPLDALAGLAGLAPARAAAILHGMNVVILRDRTVLHHARLDALAAQIEHAIAAAPAGITRDAMHFPEAIVDETIARLAARKAIRQEHGRIVAVRADQERRRAAREADHAATLATALRRAGLTPPDARQIFAQPGLRMAAEHLIREGVLVRAIDRVQKREVLFHRDAIAQAQQALAPRLAEPPGLLVSEAGTLLGISRKYSVPLLEYLDAIQYTRRQADRRILFKGNSGAQSAFKTR
jgi:selenocysteine-specific elongation factor